MFKSDLCLINRRLHKNSTVALSDAVGAFPVNTKNALPPLHSAQKADIPWNSSIRQILAKILRVPWGRKTAALPPATDISNVNLLSNV